MSIEIICRNNEINSILGINPISYKEAIERAFDKIENNEIISSWKDSYSSSELNYNISENIKVPKFGCFTDQKI